MPAGGIPPAGAIPAPRLHIVVRIEPPSIWMPAVLFRVFRVLLPRRNTVSLLFCTFHARKISRSPAADGRAIERITSDFAV